MVSFLIIAFAGFALVKFGISQWRAIWITSANQPISEALWVEAGMDGSAIGSQDFSSLMDLCDQLSPGLKKASPWLREVSIYYRALAKFERAFQLKLPSATTWANREMQVCSRYVAVLLDQSISMNLDRQIAGRTN